MNKTKTTSFLVILFLSICGFANAQHPNLEKSVEELRQLMVQPTKVGLTAITHFKLTYGHSDGKLENRDQFVEALVSKASNFTEIELSNQTIETLGKTAIVRHDLYAKTLDGGNPAEVKLHIMTVWQKQKKGWVLLARQSVRRK
ncbi:nuclear transport factor 2 family protein [uncultured Arcticibacterium sp.]|uniref:nuclear transport factor 2 family protein n=1 Tax=uncultured Arcticibacterium sp. TaxID=2173042 RepID=UPI0030F70F9A